MRGVHHLIEMAHYQDIYQRIQLHKNGIVKQTVLGINRINLLQSEIIVVIDFD